MINPMIDTKSSNLPKFVGGLGGKFVILVISILAVTLGASTYFSIKHQNEFMLEQLQDKAKLLGRYLSLASAESILVLDYEVLNEVARNTSHESRVVYSVIYDIEKRPMTSYLDRSNKLIREAVLNIGNNNLDEIVNYISKNNDLIVIEDVVTVIDSVVGYTQIGVSKEEVILAQNNELTNKILINSAIILFLSFCLYVVFRYNVLRPVKELIGGSVRIAQGDLNQHIKATSSDELGNLTHAFNDMMDRLKEASTEKDTAMGQLTELNKTLEERVTQRTGELENNEAKTRSILDNVGEGILTIDETGFVASVNPAAKQIFSYTEKEFIGLHSMLLLDHQYGDKFENNHFYYDYDDGPFAPSRAYNLAEYIGQRKDGSVFPIEMAVTRMDYDNNKMRVCIIRDITDRKRTDNELKRHRDNLEDIVKERTVELAVAKDQATMASKMKSAFLANMSHEIRTPLTAIIGFAEDLLEAKQSIEERQNAISTIVRSGNHLLSIINDILDLSKIEADKLEMESLEISPYDILSEIETLIKYQAKNKGLNFRIQYKLPLPRLIESDSVRIKQVLLNLCSNAIKFTEKGNVMIEVSFDKYTHKMKFDVIDTGIGMTEETAGKIFAAFTQADSSTTRKFGGTGLGLSLSKRLTELLGGSLSVDSIYGVGSKFRAEINVGKIRGNNLIQSMDEIDEITSVANDSEINFRQVHLKGSILLAEDTEENQKLISLYIERLGPQVTIANDGQEAVDYALSHKFDLILMDMQMPVMDGVEAMKIIREHGIETPIVALTANAMKQDRDRCQAAGSDDFVSKPIDRRLFTETLARYLDEDEGLELDESPIVSLMVDEEPALVALIKQFLGKLLVDIETLKAATKTGEWSEVKKISHNIKGGGGGFGYPMLTDVASKIQFQLAGENYTEVKSLVSELDHLCTRIDKGAA